jgi:lipoyl(octanoyl) transferase
MHNATTWRLIVDAHLPGPQNMAIDDAIITTIGEGRALPTLRLYGWQPFCLSLGYGQRVRDVDHINMQAHGWDLVRRPTGGRAILHGDELTYSLSLPIEHPLAEGDVITSYRNISRGLMEALQHLGLSPRSEKQDEEKLREAKKGAVCFEVPSHYEITAGGKKLIGSAQVRRSTAILQHGSLPLVGDVGRICEALAYEDREARDSARSIVRERATTLSEVFGNTVTWDTAADAVIKGFQDAFGVQLVEAALSAEESEKAEVLLQDTYTNAAWTEKR